MSSLKGKPPLSTAGPNFRVPVGDPDATDWDTITFETMGALLSDPALAPYTKVVKIAPESLVGDLSDLAAEVSTGAVIAGTGKLNVLPMRAEDAPANYFIFDMGNELTMIGAGSIPLMVKQANYNGVPEEDRGEFFVFFRE